MKFFKKIIKLILLFVLIIGIGLFFLDDDSSIEVFEDNQQFNEFISEIEKEYVESSTAFNLNFVLNNPQNLGYSYPTSYGLGRTTREDYDQMMESLEDILQQLRAFDINSLTQKQKVTYIAFEDSLKRDLALKDYYYNDNSAIGSYSSYIQEIPLLLEMYAFENQNNLDSFFLDIDSFKDDLLFYVDFEKEREQLGLGHCKSIIDDTITQIQEFIDSDKSETIQIIQSNIEKIDFINESEKSLYKQKVEKAINVTLVDAYKECLKAMQTLTPPIDQAKTDEKYYKAKIYNQLGISESVKKIEKNLKEAYDDSLKELKKFAKSHYDLLSIDDFYGITYDFSTPSEGLDYLKTQIFNFVPVIDDLEYSIFEVPASLQDGFAPAAYLTSRYDKTKDQKECIMINPTSSENILPSLVHEGYPGHMYQNVYKNSLDLPLIHSFINCIGYSEGWAIYVENKSADFLSPGKTKDWQKLLVLNDKLTTYALSLVDIYIHYYHYSFDEVYEFLNETLGAVDKDGLRDLYEIILQTPGYYLYYTYSGYIFETLQEQAQSVLKNKYDDISFNRILLNSGEVGLDVVRKNVDHYLFP